MGFSFCSMKKAGSSVAGGQGRPAARLIPACSHPSAASR